MFSTSRFGVVLGKAGRNIAAGMTGGIAYFLDERNDLLSKVNQEIVKVQKIITYEGESQLKKLVSLHLSKTGSPKAKIVLEKWQEFFPKFWQLVPPSEINSPCTNLTLSKYSTLF